MIRYRDLPELAKIPLRVISAKAMALEEFNTIKELEIALESCVKHEYYCAAAGIQLVIEETQQLPNQ